MFVRDECGSYAVTVQRFRSTLYTNTSTGDAPDDPARDPPETRRECQRDVKVTSRCTHKVPKEVYDEVRPELRDPRNEERGSRSLGRPSASERHMEPSKSHQHRSNSRRPHAAPSKSIKAAHLPPMPPKKAAAGSTSTVPSGQPQHRQHSSNTCQLPRGARQKLCICMPGRGSMSTRWLGVRTWDLDLPLLNRPSRRRWTRSSCEIRHGPRADLGTSTTTFPTSGDDF